MPSSEQKEPTLALGKASWEYLGALQGRWQHSLDDMGLFTVFGDVALFDRGTALRIKSDQDGRLYAWGWVLAWDISDHGNLIWCRPGEEGGGDLAVAAQRIRNLNDHAHWQEWNVKMGTCGWRRPHVELTNLQDRFVKMPPAGIPGLPERVSMFAVPPPADMPVNTKPWRLLVYGGCLTIGWPSGDVYARTLVDHLGELGVFSEVIGCGVSAHTSDQLAASMWRKDLYDKMGLRGEGLLRLLKRQGPFDLVLIMVGIADVVRGQVSDCIPEMHRACHREGVRTVAVSIPPSWHDTPEDMHESDVKRAKSLDERFGFVSPKTVRKLKLDLNRSLRNLAEEKRLERGHCALYVETGPIVPCDKNHRQYWELADFIHLTGFGYQSLGWGIAEQLAPLLESMGKFKSAASKPVTLEASWSKASQVWRVRGGMRKGGLIVRQDKDIDSLFHSGRLCNGALLEEMELRDDRLHYRKISGEGPVTGWVTIRTQTGKVLVETCSSPAGTSGATLELGNLESQQALELAGDAGPVKQSAETGVEPVQEAEPEPALEDPLEAEASLGLEAAVATVLKPSTDRVWRVIGGQNHRGLVVRHGKDQGSPAHTIRLVNGSIVEEIELCGVRLHYRMRVGNGPYTGWVSTSVKGRKLVEPDNAWEDTDPKLGLKCPASAYPKPRQGLVALGAQTTTAKQEPAIVWRCVFQPRVMIRTLPSRSSPAVGLLDYGKEVEAEGEPVDGWIRLLNGHGYVLTKHEEMGTLLTRTGNGP